TLIRKLLDAHEPSVKFTLTDGTCHPPTPQHEPPVMNSFPIDCYPGPVESVDPPNFMGEPEPQPPGEPVALQGESEVEGYRLGFCPTLAAHVPAHPPAS
ncbi:unnamed protein product, partial [Symbiodinium sp. KB8]